MTPEELMLLKETVRNMREGNLTKKEKVIFVTGIQAGLFSDDKTVQELLNEVADLCLDEADGTADVKIFDN
jgi:hypothetical protein